LPSKEHEIIKQIKIAEQQSAEAIKNAKNEAAILIEKAQSDRVRQLEDAKAEAREILKVKIAEAKDPVKHEKLIEEAKKQSQIINESCDDRLGDVAEQVITFILEED
jgi:vacuolar-type H+-ATPase subunit H